ncbi:MYND-type zinc finger protein [Yarrowia sp. E02]|nr:MYND-type zinc finger protein [Yarrowia sp. E02]
MRESNFRSVPSNRASVTITTTLYDRRALDCTSDKPLINSLNHLTYLTSSSARVRETLCTDGGLERLVAIMKTCQESKHDDKHSDKNLLVAWKWALAFQCLVFVGTRGTEAIRKRIVEAGLLPVLASVLDNYLLMMEDAKAEQELLRRRAEAEQEMQRRQTDEKERSATVTACNPFGISLCGSTREASAAKERELAQGQGQGQGQTGRRDCRIHSAISSAVSSVSRLCRTQTPVPEEPQAGSSRDSSLHSSFSSSMIDSASSTSSSTTTTIMNSSTTITTPSLRQLLSESAILRSGASVESFETATQNSAQSQNDDAQMVDNDTGLALFAERDADGDVEMGSDDFQPRRLQTAQPQQQQPQQQQQQQPAQPGQPTAAGQAPTPRPGPGVAPVTAQGAISSIQSSIASMPRIFENGILMPRDDDVLWALEILAYVSKYSSTKDCIQTCHFVPDLSLRDKNLPPLRRAAAPQPLMRSKFGSHEGDPVVKIVDVDDEDDYKGKSICVDETTEVDGVVDDQFLDDHRTQKQREITAFHKRVTRKSHRKKTDWEKAYDTYDFESEEDICAEFLGETINVFPIVEKFTVREYSNEIQYWAGVIMRNSCRKNEARGGIRQCAHFDCGKWEEFPRQFAKCRRCKRTKYCSRDCQLKAWNYHKHWCSTNPPNVASSRSGSSAVTSSAASVSSVSTASTAATASTVATVNTMASGGTVASGTEGYPNSPNSAASASSASTATVAGGSQSTLSHSRQNMFRSTR